MRLTSDEINEAIRSGDDSKVLSYLYGNLLPKVRKHVIRNSGSKDDADDVFQDAVLKLYKRIMEGKELLDNPEGFLFQIAKNLWTDKVKSIAKANCVSDQEASMISIDQNAMEHMLAEEKNKAIVELFEMVGEKCLKIMEMHFFENKSMEEISSILGMSGADSVKAQHYRCKQKLIQLMEQRQDLSKTLNINY